LEEFYQGFLVGVVVFPVAEIADYFAHNIRLSRVFLRISLAIPWLA